MCTDAAPISKFIEFTHSGIWISTQISVAIMNEVMRGNILAYHRIQIFHEESSRRTSSHMIFSNDRTLSHDPQSVHFEGHPSEGAPSFGSGRDPAADGRVGHTGPALTPVRIYIRRTELTVHSASPHDRRGGTEGTIRCSCLYAMTILVKLQWVSSSIRECP